MTGSREDVYLEDRASHSTPTAELKRIPVPWTSDIFSVPPALQCALILWPIMAPDAGLKVSLRRCLTDLRLWPQGRI